MEHEFREQELKDFNDDRNDEMRLMIINEMKKGNIDILKRKKEVRPFFYATYRCLECDSLIHSTYPGEWVSCKCGKSFVDQDEYICRLGGHPVREYDRSENRISYVLDRLERLWRQYPQLRLMQLIENAIPKDQLYYLEDEDLVSRTTLFYYEQKHEPSDI